VGDASTVKHALYYIGLQLSTRVKRKISPSLWVTVTANFILYISQQKFKEILESSDEASPHPKLGINDTEHSAK
jgi:hypothetical protein